MITVEDLIKILKSQLGEGNLIIHKNIESKQVKIYKTVSYKLYLTLKRKKYLLLKFDTTTRMLVDQEDKKIKETDLLFLSLLFKYIQSEEWKNVIKGEVDGLDKI